MNVRAHMSMLFHLINASAATPAPWPANLWTDRKGAEYVVEQRRDPPGHPVSDAMGGQERLTAGGYDSKTLRLRLRSKLSGDEVIL
jgi:hypothetical protein